jgi:hypothetical protein
MKAIGAASKHGRLDLFIQSTDKVRVRLRVRVSPDPGSP